MYLILLLAFICGLCGIVPRGRKRWRARMYRSDYNRAKTLSASAARGKPRVVTGTERLDQWLKRRGW